MIVEVDENSGFGIVFRYLFYYLVVFIFVDFIIKWVGEVRIDGEGRGWIMRGKGERSVIVFFFMFE